MLIYLKETFSFLTGKSSLRIFIPNTPSPRTGQVSRGKSYLTTVCKIPDCLLPIWEEISFLVYERPRLKFYLQFKTVNFF